MAALDSGPRHTLLVDLQRLDFTRRRFPFYFWWLGVVNRGSETQLQVTKK